MKKLIAVIVCLFTSSPVAAQVSSPRDTEAQVVSSRRVPLKEMSPLEEIWAARKKALAAGDVKAADGALDRLYQEELNLGLTNLFLYSSALIREGAAASREGKVKEGLDLVERAAALSPDFPPAYFSASRISLGSLDIAGALSYGLKGVRSVPRSFFSALSALGNALFGVLGALLMSIALYTAIILIRYAKLFSHDVGDLFPGHPPRLAVLALGLLILFLPLLLDVGPLWLVAWCLLLTFPYGNRGEIAVTIVFFLLLASSPAVLRMVASFLASTPSGVVQDLAQARAGEWNTGMEDSLKEWAKNNAGDREVLTVIGLIEKKKGDLRSAADFYGKAQTAASSSADDASLSARVHVNLGNVLFGLGNQDGAVKEYKKAIEQDPDMASAHYNLGQVYIKRGMIEGEQELRKAKDLDPDLSAYYTEIFSPALNRLLIDEGIPVGVLINRFLSPTPEKAQIMNGLFLWVMKGVDVDKVTLLAGVLIVLSIVFRGVLQRVGAAHSCERCGRPSCARCLGGVRSDLCLQCYSIYVRKEGIDPNVRIRKDAENRRREGRRILFSRICAFVLPGSGQMLRGDAVRGMAFAVVCAALFLKIIFWEGFIRYRFPVTSSFPALTVAALSFALVLGYLLCLASYLRSE